jgi:hypothetical protein
MFALTNPIAFVMAVWIYSNIKLLSLQSLLCYVRILFLRKDEMISLLQLYVHVVTIGIRVVVTGTVHAQSIHHQHPIILRGAPAHWRTPMVPTPLGQWQRQHFKSGRGGGKIMIANTIIFIYIMKVGGPAPSISATVGRLKASHFLVVATPTWAVSCQPRRGKFI